MWMDGWLGRMDPKNGLEFYIYILRWRVAFVASIDELDQTASASAGSTISIALPNN